MLALSLKARQQVTITHGDEVLTVSVDLDKDRSTPNRPQFKMYFDGPLAFAILRENAKKRSPGDKAAPRRREEPAD